MLVVGKEGCKMAKIRDVEPKYANRLLVELDSGRVFLINMTEKIETMRFHDLKDEFLFMSVSTDGDSVIWDNGRISLSLSEIFDMTKVRRDNEGNTKAI